MGNHDMFSLVAFSDLFVSNQTFLPKLLIIAAVEDAGSNAR